MAKEEEKTFIDLLKMSVEEAVEHMLTHDASKQYRKDYFKIKQLYLMEQQNEIMRRSESGV